MARINLNEFGGQAGGLAYRVNQVRTDPVVTEAAKDALRDVKVASRSCSVLAREATAAWQRTRPTPSTSAAYRAGRPVTPAAQPAQPTHQAAQPTHQPAQAQDVQDRPSYSAAS